jgi:hypothetical protein
MNILISSSSQITTFRPSKTQSFPSLRRVEKFSSHKSTRLSMLWTLFNVNRNVNQLYEQIWNRILLRRVKL